MLRAQHGAWVFALGKRDRSRANGRLTSSHSSVRPDRLTPARSPGSNGHSGLHTLQQVWGPTPPPGRRLCPLDQRLATASHPCSPVLPSVSERTCLGFMGREIRQLCLPLTSLPWCNIRSLHVGVDSRTSSFFLF